MGDESLGRGLDKQEAPSRLILKDKTVKGLTQKCSVSPACAHVHPKTIHKFLRAALHPMMKHTLALFMLLALSTSADGHDKEIKADGRGGSKHVVSKQQASKHGAAVGNSSDFGDGKGKGRDKPLHCGLPVGGIVVGVAALAVVGIGFRKYRARATAANSNDAPLPAHAMTQPLPPAMTQSPKLALTPISLEKHNSMV